MPANTRPGGEGQYEIGLFSDLTKFDELERKISELIQRFSALRSENAELRIKLAEIEDELQQKNTEIELLTAQRDILIRNQRDSDREELIRQKIQDLLDKLERYQ